MQRIAIDLDADDDDVTTTAVATPARAVSSTAAPKRRWGQAVKGVKNGLEGTLVRSSGLGAIGATVAVSSDGWLTLTGDDAMKSQSLQEAKAEWHQAMVEMQASTFEDRDFNAEPRSICGKNEETISHDGETTSELRCRCGKSCKKSEVKKEGPTKGRPYWHCETRRCGFFAWADSQHRRHGKIWWQRFPEFLLVSDFGFRAEDLKQGGVGDCWFLSALAVVAQRPDLILRLFGGETARNAVGCYQINLFLDGEWKAVTIDDRLPCTDQQRRPDGSGLAFSRADGQQLWVPLLEKAYAKAHGSYQAISGGEIAEALLDLTGCPTESIDFDEPGFDPQELWQRLMDFKAADFPMGCATAGNPELREVGLCGNHAYSVLDVREIFDPRFISRELGYGGAHQEGLVRLLRIRNPHGVGEWNGEWSDQSTEWTESLSSELGCTGVDDGTFWMDYTHFLMAFQVVDVCLAHRGWNAASFANAFCAKSSGSRICKNLYELRSDRPTTLYAMALQPTKRGAWCREDRKKSYKPGDLSLLVLRLSDDGAFQEVVGGNFFCADIMARRCVEAQLEAKQRYLLVAFSFGSGPVAHGGEVRGSAPFKLRLFASQPLGVRVLETERHPQMVESALSGLHAAPLTLRSAPGRRFRRLRRALGKEDLSMFQVTGEGAVLLLVANASSEEATLRLRAEVKVMTARSSEGLLVASAKEEKPGEVTCFNCGKLGHLAQDCPSAKSRGIRTPWRYPAKWRRVQSICRIPPKTQRLCMVLIGNGMQAELGGVEVEVAGAGEEWASVPGRQQALSNWLKVGRSSQPLDAFEARPLMEGLVATATTSSRPMLGTCQVEDLLDRLSEDALQQAAASSLVELQAQEEQQLQQALAASAGDECSEERWMVQALAESMKEALVEDEDAELQAALRLSVKDQHVTQLVIESSDEEAGVAAKRHKAKM
mgnify:FL=1